MPGQVLRYVPLGDLPRRVWLPEESGPGGLKTLTLGKKLLVARKLIIQGKSAVFSQLVSPR